MANLSLRLVIHGRVQGVGFRYWMAREAEMRALDGWVRNLPDGTVEALIAGPEHAVRDMTRECHNGPRFSQVELVEQSPAELPTLTGFRQIR